MSDFLIPMDRGSHSDPLAFIGFADLIEELSGGEEVSLDYQGGYGVVSTNREVQQLLSSPFTPGFKYIKVAKDKNPAPPDAFDYEENKRLYEESKEASKQLNKLKSGTKKKSEVSQELDETLKQLESKTKPPEDWYIFQQFNVMQGIPLSNSIYNMIKKEDFKMPDLSTLCQGDWPESKIPSKTNQLLHPAGGKGMWGAKGRSPQGASGLGSQHINGFATWMMIRGLWKSAAIIPLGDDLKIYVLVPGKITMKGLNRIRGDWSKKSIWGTPIKSDIFRTIDIVTLLVDHILEQKQRGRFTFNLPSELIHSIRVGWYKSLGTSRALGGINILALPQWYEVKEEADRHRWTDALEAHRRVAARLDEGRTEELNLLQAQRLAISSNDFYVVLNYHSDYAAGLVQLYAQDKKYLYAYPEKTLKEVLKAMSEKEDLQRIKALVDDEDFNAVAKAIRTITITALRRGKEAKIQPFYGLPQEWKRVSKFPKEFLVEFGDFVSRYNNELAKIEAEHKDQGYLPGAYIRENQSKKIIDAIAELGSEVICHLLLAIGTAASEKTKSDKEPVEG